jgi:hypothetical protein
MNRIWLFSALLAALLAAGAWSTNGSAAPSEGPVAFLDRVVTALVANDYGTAWQSLHPLHQEVAGEAEYAACEALSPIPGRLESLAAIRTRRKLVAIAGLAQRVRGVVVTFRLRLSDPMSGMTTAFTLNAATVRAGDRWAWMLPRSRYELYKAGACGEL